MEFLENDNTAGVALLAEGNYPAAEAAFRRAVAAQPQDHSAWNNLGFVLQQQGRYPEAEEALRHALALHPQSANAWLNLGNLCVQTQRAEEGAACYSRALEIDRRNVQAWESMAMLAMLQQSYAEAADCWQNILSLQPNQARAWVQLGVARAAQGAVEVAIDCMQQATRCQDGYAPAWSHYALLEMGRKNYGTAHTYFEKALSLQEDPDTRYHYAVNLLALGHTAQAAAQYDTLLRQQPAHAKWLTERGVLALGSGAPLVAKGYFERALQAQPGYERAQSYLDGLGM